MRALVFLTITSSGMMGVNADPLVDFSYGVLSELRGEEAEAADFYKKAYVGDPAALPLVRIEARRLLAEGDRAGALDVYQNLIAERADEPLLNIEFGDFVGRIGDGDSLAGELREEAYQKVLEAFPGGYLPVERLLRMAREEGDDRRAREILDELELDNEAAILYYVATTKSLYDSRDDEAAVRIDEAFDRGVKDHAAQAGLARKASDHFRETGRAERAIDVLRDHVEAVPFSLDLKVRLGILMFSEGLDTEGLEVLNEVLTVHPRKRIAHEALAKYFRMNGMERKARSHAAELLKIRRGSPGDFIKLADELMEAEEFRDARLLLEKAVFDHAGDVKLRMKLAMATARDPETKGAASRLFEEAESMLAEGGEMEPSFMLDSAVQLLANGETKAAEDRLRTAIKTFPKDAGKDTAAALRGLAGIWISEGRNVDAAQALIRRAESLEK